MRRFWANKKAANHLENNTESSWKQQRGNYTERKKYKGTQQKPKKRDHLRSLWRSIVLVTVRRWQRSAVAEGRWGSLNKCGVTKLVTVHRFYDGPSCRFVMKFREVIPVPIFQELKCFGTKILTDHCAYDGPSYMPSRVMKKSSRRNCTSMGWRSPWRSVVTTLVRREVRRQPRFGRFPANRVLV